MKFQNRYLLNLKLLVFFPKVLNATCNSALSISSKINGDTIESDIEIYGEEEIISEKLISEFSVIDKSIKNLVTKIKERGGLRLLDENY